MVITRDQQRKGSTSNENPLFNQNNDENGDGLNTGTATEIAANSNEGKTPINNEILRQIGDMFENIKSSLEQNQNRLFREHEEKMEKMERDNNEKLRQLTEKIENRHGSSQAENVHNGGFGKGNDWKANFIFLNVFGFPNSFIDRFDSFEELIQSKDNLLAHAELFKKQPIKFFDREKYEKNVAKYGIFHKEPICITKNLLIAIDIAKILPAFSRLNLDQQANRHLQTKGSGADNGKATMQLYHHLHYTVPSANVGSANVIIAVSNFAMAASFLIGRFNSMKINSETQLIEIIDYPFVKLHILPNPEEPVIKILAEDIFCLSMKKFLQIAPIREEFVLILTLLFTNSAIPSLSKYGQEIMNEEKEKCAKILLRFQQMKFGDQKGALRYSECLQLLWSTIYSIQKHKELINYIDTISEQGSFSTMMPKILRPLMM